MNVLHKKAAVFLLAGCMSMGALTGCGNGNGRVTTDHNIPSDVSNTTMGTADGNLPVDYNQLEGSDTAPAGDETQDEGIVPSLEGETPDADGAGDEPAISADGEAPSGAEVQEPGQEGEVIDEQVPADGTEVDDEGVPTLKIPDGVDVTEEIVNLERTIPEMSDLEVSAPGTQVVSNDYAFIDYTNMAKGYVVAQYTDPAEQARLKCIVQGPSTSYNYNITAGKQEVLPLSDGNGPYKITVYRNIKDTKYATILTADISVKMESEFAPFLNSNQYVDFYSAPNTVLKATSLCSELSDPLEKVAAVYDFVVKNIAYDTEKAASVQSGYLPVLDDVLSSQKGICFDYAALMTGMLRSQNVPCKLVVGYAGGVYHAWISVWSDEMGWVEGFVYFDGITWQRMDPTFDSNAGGSDSIREFIGNGSNYSVKYLY